MPYQSKETLTLSDRFLQPTNSTHRQYEALRAYYVEGLTSVEVAQRFGYAPGSFRVLAHQFGQAPERPFFLPSKRETKPDSKRRRLRDRVVAMRKQNLSVQDISRAISYNGERISAATVSTILKEEGFARLPRRLDEERPEVVERGDAAAQPGDQHGSEAGLARLGEHVALEVLHVAGGQHGLEPRGIEPPGEEDRLA